MRLGSYELIEPIGAGGMGEVWRALDPDLGRHVAIKILPSQYSSDPGRLRRFEQEARAAGKLNHPNVLTIYAIGRDEDRPYLVTELLEGSTLRRQLADGAIPEGKAIEYACDIAQGLAAAHEKSIVHRDLKPDNIFITTDGRVKILDFGLAKLTQVEGDQAQTQTASGVTLGTPAYMSPEQVRGQPADHRSDIFSFGAVLYEMLTGRRAFSSDTSAETMTAILRQEPPPLSGAAPQIEQIVRHCLEKEPANRYQSARDLGFQLRLAQHPSAATAPMRAQPSRRRLAFALIGLAALVAAVTLAWWVTRSVPPATTLTFRRLTADSGLTTDPALSSDGQLIVYASDRAGANNLDIWRQQLATGEAVPLTSDPADESEPVFSPDGSRIAFRSERDGGGIYVVSAFGGEPRLIARHGRRPRFSPDGMQIAYWVRSAVFYLGSVFVVPTAGGSPVPVQPGFASALFPIWSADGKSLLMLGIRDWKDIPAGALDWWVTPLGGSPPIKTGAFDILTRQGIGSGRPPFPLIAPAGWIGDDVYFSGWADERANLWRVSVPPATGKAEGSAVRLTSGTSIEAKPFVLAEGRLVFASLTEHLNIWSVPIIPNRGSVKGDATQVTHAALDAHTSLTADGKKLVFISTRSGNPDVWMKDLVSGKESALIATPTREEQPEITADGTRVCYVVIEEKRWGINQIDTAGGPPESLCTDCGRPWDWSPDGTKILYLIPEGRKQPGLAIGLLDVPARQTRDYLAHRAYSLARARFSPDGRWISFLAFGSAGLSRVVVAPFQSDTPPSEDRWITVAEARVLLEKPRWSPDGNLLYYMSDADGFRCIWARRLNPTTKQPAGQPFAVYHSHMARRSLMNAWPGVLEISLSPDRLFFNLAETTGNIWMAEPKSAAGG